MNKLAIRVRNARHLGRKWDGPGGIVEDPRFPEINSADEGRELLREVAWDTRTADSYELSPQPVANRGRPAARIAVAEEPDGKRKRDTATSPGLPPLTGCDWPQATQVMRALAGTDDDELPLFGRFPA